jgi:hypothetical protein
MASVPLGPATRSLIRVAGNFFRTTRRAGADMIGALVRWDFF